MSTPKEKHYWSQLRAALTAGQWRSPTPAKTPKGGPLSWSELFRKFNKHCRGYQDVAQVALKTQELALLLCVSEQDEDEDEVDLERPPLGIGRECLLPAESVEEANAGYEILKTLESSNFDTINFALAYYAYALGNPSDCILHLKRVPELLQFRNRVPSGSTRSITHGLAPSASTYSSTSFAGSFTSVIDPTVPEVRDGRGWAMAETFRSLCLQGMAYERLEPTNPHRALKAYSDALPLFPSLNSEITSKFIPQPSGKMDFASFLQLRELWRWVERLLFRAIVLSSQTTHIHLESEQDQREGASLWTWLGHYSTCSACWPSNFRTAHRSTIASLYLRALIVRNATHHSSSSSALSSSNTPDHKSNAWLGEARSVIQDYRAILTSSTKFPQAGHQNIKVEEFVDLCVAVWEAAGGHGEQAGWVIDILWWATRLTFNSSRVLRHMTRLLYLSGDAPLAKRTLRLYIQVVGKAYEASKEGVGEDKDTDECWVETLVFGARMLCKCADAQPGLCNVEDIQEAGKVLEKARTRLDPGNKRLTAKVELAEGVVGSLLAIKGHDPLTRDHHLYTAHEHFLRSVWEDRTALGCYHLALSFATRGPAHDAGKAVEFAGLAVELNSQDVRCWHLLGVLLTKQEKWKEAMEILEQGGALDGMDEIPESSTQPNEGRRSGDEEEESGTVVQDTRTVLAQSTVNGEVKTFDFASTPPGSQRVNGNGFVVDDDLTPKPTTSRRLSRRLSLPASDQRPPAHFVHPHTHVLSFGTTEIPPAATLLRPELWSIYPPSQQELFEYHLQLRMTQAAVTEVIEGPEGAEIQWVDIFAWVAERKGTISNGTSEANGPTHGETPRRSMEGIRQSASHSQLNVSTSDGFLSPHASSSLQPSSTTSSSLLNTTTRTSIPSESMSTLEPPPPIPITISPATPEIENLRADTASITDGEKDAEKEKTKGEGKDKEKEKKDILSGLRKRSTSIDQDTRDIFKSKKMGQMLKNRVHKGRAGITAVSKKIGNGVTRTGGLRRSSSTPDFHAVLYQTSYQASSIHSRRRLSSIIQSQDRTPTASPPPPPPPIPSPTPTQDFKLKNDRSSRQNRLLSELWLMAAATFRRIGKIEQTKGAIQEAEVKDENNPEVWVQLGLYYIELGLHQHAMDAFQKALFISPDDVSATVHLARLYLDPDLQSKEEPTPPPAATSDYHKKAASSVTACPSVDLAAGMLAYLTKGRGWDVPEAWYFLAKAYGLQDQKTKEKEILSHALCLAEQRSVRDIGLALGWCA